MAGSVLQRTAFGWPPGRLTAAAVVIPSVLVKPTCIGAALAFLFAGAVAGCGGNRPLRPDTYGITMTVPGVGLGGLSGIGTRSATATYGVRERSLVLGSRTSFLPLGRGWGTPQPAALDNGGDPSGKAWQLRWVGWGRGVASGSGLTYVLGIGQAGYHIGRVEFRASRIGRCYTDGPRAYTRLEVRVAGLHAGDFTAWQLWNGRPNLCHA